MSVMRKKNLLGFKSTLIMIGSLLIFLSLSLFFKGMVIAMSEFKVPTEVLSSLHYIDAISWVYIHQLVIGLLIILLGISIKEISMQRWVSIILLLIMSFYAYIDFKNSDSKFGNGLYQGEASLIPAIMCLLFALLFLQLTIRLFVVEKE